MNYNLSQAIGLFNQDQIRTQTMYEIEFSSGFDTIDKTLHRMQVYGQNFTLPDRTVNFENLQYRAYNIPVPTTLEMGQDHSVTVYADVRGDLRRALLDWQAACINPDITMGSYFESNRRPTRLGHGGDSEPYILVHLLAPDYYSHVESTLIHGSRVMKVGGLELSNTSGSISTFTVDFKSVYWEQVFGDKIGRSNDDTLRNAELGNPNEDGDGNRATEDYTDKIGGAGLVGSDYGGGAVGANGNAIYGVGGNSGNNFGPLSR